MPIFEFKCLKCNEVFELLTFGPDDTEVSCPKCRSESFERVLSATNHSMGSGKGGGVSSQTRNCSSGSCTTYTIPGPTG